MRFSTPQNIVLYIIIRFHSRCLTQPNGAVSSWLAPLLSTPNFLVHTGMP
jgi:hypothetical protein